MATTEIPVKKIERSPEAYEAIKKMRAEIRKLALEQKQRRLNKTQKSVSARVRITVLHRMYLKIRNKDEGAHNIREGWEWYAGKYQKEYYDLFELGPIFND
jgi:hypothetical protein